MPDRLSSIESELQNRWPENKLEPTLGRISALLKLAGDPHRGYSTIHITGTNGKSTTARMIDEVLRAAGLRTGRYTSPHLVSVRERIVIDGHSVDADMFVEVYDFLRPHIDTVDAVNTVPLSFFEIMTAIGLMCFARAGVEVAVVEVGIGGRWDATNVVDGRVCVITPISLDHTDFLGPDENSIAIEKSRIVKLGSTLVTGRQSEEISELLAARAASVGAVTLHSCNAVDLIDRVQHHDRQTLRPACHPSPGEHRRATAQGTVETGPFCAGVVDRRDPRARGDGGVAPQTSVD
ncbi:bifunctional folylpolyglutamate synthase/dihydrofolate synthase [Rhodococcus opacus]|uniref:bifunctional folylpolyglutamate synthase/dihydrofolate synthase n=1 Tax=Rhodococcus opacus TaxID=37919 RepID=UPI00155AEB74|nr:Mur ligase family protein [Rhodococcus opacus]